MSKAVAQFMGEIATQLEEQRIEGEEWNLRYVSAARNGIAGWHFDITASGGVRGGACSGSRTVQRWVTIGPMDVQPGFDGVGRIVLGTQHQHVHDQDSSIILAPSPHPSFCVRLFLFRQLSTPLLTSLLVTPSRIKCITTPNSSTFRFRLSSSKNNISS